MGEWMSAPTVSGLYWAWREGRTRSGQASICKVNVLGSDRWSVTFLNGQQAYTFRAGQGWYWKPAEPPVPPGKPVAA